MQQRTRRQDLRPGMHVVSYGQGSFNDPVVKVDKPILTPADVDRLVPGHVREVVIDTQADVPPPGATGIAEELSTAKRLHAEALAHVKSFVDDVRRGTDIDVRAAEPLVRNFIASVFRNESAAITLFKLRGFDAYTYTHSINVSLLAVLLGKHLGLDEPTLLELGLAGMYHDVGKARIPEAVLNKPGRLSEAEFAVMKSHPLEGYKILAAKQDRNPEILRAVLEHHERHDGSGYPRGLRGEAIGLFSRVVSIVDVYDALTSRRVYKEPMAPSKALGLMYQWRDRDFPPQAVENFIRCVGVFPLGSFVRLSNGEYGIVASVNPLAATRPEVKVVLDARLRPLIPRVADLQELSGTPEALEIAEVLNPADLKIDLERFLLA
jgi:putative nucleotidyltransferase with HDIG domain